MVSALLLFPGKVGEEGEVEVPVVLFVGVDCISHSFFSEVLELPLPNYQGLSSSVRTLSILCHSRLNEGMSRDFAMNDAPDEISIHEVLPVVIALLVEKSDSIVSLLDTIFFEELLILDQSSPPLQRFDQLVSLLVLQLREVEDSRLLKAHFLLHLLQVFGSNF